MSSNSSAQELAPLQLAMLGGRQAGCDLEQLEVVLKGVDRSQVTVAWAALVASVEALNLGFVFEHGSPVGFERRVAPELLVHDEEPANLADWLAEDRLVDFDWEKGVPWRVVYFAGSRRLVWTFHHALLHGRSFSAVLRCFLEKLAGRESGKLKLLRWTSAGEPELERAQTLWREWFQEVDSVRWDDGGSTANLVDRSDVSLTESLEARATELGVTAATMITWAWAQAVACEARVAKVSLGQVRSGPPVGDCAGFGMNTLPLVVSRFSGGDLGESVSELRRKMMQLREVESVSVDKLPPETFGEACVPWLSVLMVERGTMDLVLESEPWAAEFAEQIKLHERAAGDLVASAYLRPSLKLEIEAGPKVGAQAVKRLLEHWRAILDALAQGQQGVEVTAFPKQWTDLLEKWEWGGDAWAGAQSVAEEWERVAAENAECIAISDSDGDLSYEVFRRRINGLAEGLALEGVKRGDRVGVSFVQRRHWPLAIFALAKLGAIYVPLDRKVPDARLRAMVEDAGMDLLVCDDEIDLGCRTVRLDPLREAEGGEWVEAKVLALLYTSGSTGVPKGVIVDQTGVLNEVKAVAKLLELRPGERMLQFTSPGFDASLEEMLSTLLVGATLVPRAENASEDFEAFENYVTELEVTILNLPTAFWAAWCGWMRDAKRSIPAKVRAVVIGGERLSETALKDWMAAGGGERSLLNTYGPTEASIAASYEMIDSQWSEVGDPPIGRPLSGYQIMIADASGERLPPGAWGELWIGGIGVSSGYWNREEETRKAFVDLGGEVWYRSGDRARWDSEGKLHFGGRIDDQVKIRGHRIEPDEVIRLLESRNDVASAYVAAVENGKALAGWVKWSGSAAPDDWVAQLRAFLQDKLATASIPTRWALVDGFRLTERGKLDRRSLPEPEAVGANDYEAPVSEGEKKIAAMWCELLELDAVGRNDDFFELGGSSLLALRLFAAVTREFDVSLPMAELLRSPKLKDLARSISEKNLGGDRDGIPVVVPLREGEKSEPLFCVHGGDGGVIFYRELAQRMSKGRPMLSIESPELSVEGALEEHEVEDIAERYLLAVREKQPKGPYHLAGYSFGGVMVYEMARRLIEEGEEVAFLGLFDTENPAANWRRYSLLERIKVFWRSNLEFSPMARAGLVVSRAIQGVATHVRTKVENMAARDAKNSAPYSRLRMLQVRLLHETAMDAYVPKPLDLEMVLFRTEAIDDKFEVASDYGWGDLVRKLKVVDVSGEHLTMFDSEHVDDLARQVEEYL